MTLGLTNGTQNFGIAGYTGSNQAYMSPDTYGKNIGDNVSPSGLSKNWLGVGITSDPNNSGIITTFSGLTLGTVASEKLGNFYIHY